MSLINIIIPFLVLLLLIITTNSVCSSMVAHGGDSPCPEGMYQARCIGPNGEPVCVPLTPK